MGSAVAPAGRLNWSPPTVASAVGLGLAVGVVAVLVDWRLLVPLAIALPLSASALAHVLSGAPTLPARPVQPMRELSVLHGMPFLSVTWAALIVFNLLRLLSPNRAASAAAQGDASVDNLLQLGATGLAALVVASLVVHGWSRPVPRTAVLFVLFGLWAAASVMWSESFIYTLARGPQYLVLALFTAYTAARAATEPGFTDELLFRVVRLVTVYVVLASLLWLAEVGIDNPRVNWRGNSPNTVGAAMMLPVLGILAHPWRDRITRPVPWWSVVGLLTVLLYFTRSRTFMAAAVGTALVLLLMVGRRRSQLLAVGVGSLMVVGALAVTFAWEQVLGMVFRGESAERVTGFAGRVDLWRWVLDHPAGSEIWGVGLGASRGRIPADWNPDNAHNAWVDLLQDLGVVGVGLMAAVVLSVLVLVVARRSLHGAWTISVVAVGTITGVSIGQPGWAAALLALAVVAVHDRDVLAEAVTPRWALVSSRRSPDQEGHPHREQQGPQGAESDEDDGRRDG